MTRPPAVETRFAVVLNGGVSLAIWMGGVVHELNRLRMASLGAAPEGDGGANAGERCVHDAWRAILERTGRSVVVDAVAGTSAGGLNGAFLATAVGRGADLPLLKPVWSGLAALQRGALLRSDKEAAPSVLDGEYFARSIAGVVDSITPRSDIAPLECTLLLTATALRPAPRRYDLEGGLAAWAVDSRRVYRFRRLDDADGATIEDHFDPGDDGAGQTIVTAARASASFPLAFEPVWESAALRERRRDAANLDPPTWLIDGGVLDNAPFEPLLDELRHRAVAAPFERVVLYVTPSAAAQAVAGPPWTGGDPPDPAQIAGAVVSAIREPDQRADLATLAESFERASFTRSGPAHLLADLLSPRSTTLLAPDAALVSADALFPAYRARRLEEAERWLLGIDRPPQLVPPLALELTDDEWPVVPEGPLHDPHDWQWGLPTAARILRWWGRALVRTSGELPGLDVAFGVLDRAQRRVRALRREEDDRLAESIEATTSPHARLVALRKLHEELGARTEVARLVGQVTDAVAAAWGGGGGAELAQYSLDLEVVASALALDTSDRPGFRYRQVTPAASPLIAVEATGYADWPAKKLYGERWGHFGAFGSRDGRAHDWLWGRLDGASALCEYLLGPDFADDPACQALGRAILAADGISPEELADDALRAYRMTPDQMLRDMVADDPVAVGDSLDLLVDTIPEVLGQIHGAGPALEWVLARDIDHDDVPPDAGIGERLKLGLARLSTMPIRLYLDHVIDHATDPQSR
ncbi:DUF3376 domain-containing protein [Nocardioides sp. GXZ039]|uniref:DUF3376 domain-containing protein n=1 Tax=Nocardioides sp. GXZ039 TaxID=3136018 RepID=UPI0030F3B4A9